MTVGASVTNQTPVLTVTNGVASWNAVNGADRYELWVDEVDPQNPNRRITIRAYWGRVQATSVDLNSLPEGAYRGWLRLIDSNGQTSNWSAEVDFTITVVDSADPGLDNVTVKLIQLTPSEASRQQTTYESPAVEPDDVDQQLEVTDVDSQIEEQIWSDVQWLSQQITEAIS